MDGSWTLFLFIVWFHHLSLVSSVSIDINESSLDSLIKQIEEEKMKLAKDWKQLTNEKTSMKKSAKMSDPIGLNVGGEKIITTRATLTRVPNSILARLFNERWEDKLSRGENGNIYLDFNPILFHHLLERLRFYPHDVASSPPLNSRSFESMLNKLGLRSLAKILPNQLVKFNVGGQSMITQRKTLSQSNLVGLLFDKLNETRKISSQKLNTFVDADPELFRYIINEFRQNQTLKPTELRFPSIQKQKPFHRLLQTILFTSTTTKRPQVITPRFSSFNMTWSQQGVTVAGGHLFGNGLNQLSYPFDIDIDDSDTMFIADYENHRIIEWKLDDIVGRIVAGGNGPGNRSDQLYQPMAILCDRTKNRLIISDYGNERIIEVSLIDRNKSEVLISNIRSRGLAIDDERSLYLTDFDNHAVWRYRENEEKGTMIAGGNGRGTRSDQFDGPYDVFVDQDHSIYVSDENNNRIMKWTKNSQEGMIVAGGYHSGGYSNMHLAGPRGIYVDPFGSIYITDGMNHRVMRWLKDGQQGTIIVGGRGEGSQTDQLSYPRSLTFDHEGYLYVVDRVNHRIQQYSPLYLSDEESFEENAEDDIVS